MPYLNQIVTFIESLGIRVQTRSLADDTFLPGVQLEANTVVYDPEKLLYPGDLLHEAGHLAVTTSQQRHAIGTPLLEEPWPTDGEEIVAVLWSYAAAKHIHLPVEVVFHPNGYKNQSDWLIDSFTSGNFIGLPLLEWMGLTWSNEKAAEAGKLPFPHMIQWLRD